MKTTLNKIRDKSPCSGGWTKLLKSLNKTKADDEPVSIIQILDSNGLDDALWCLRAVTGRDREMRHYAVWCARQVEHFMTDQRSKDALNVAERFADGNATQTELAAAMAASRAARNAAWAAASAAWAAAWDAASAAQEKKLRELCAWCDQNPDAFQMPHGYEGMMWTKVYEREHGYSVCYERADIAAAREHKIKEEALTRQIEYEKRGNDCINAWMQKALDATGAQRIAEIALNCHQEREIAIVRATQSAINAAMFEEYGTSTGVRVDPATILNNMGEKK